MISTPERISDLDPGASEPPPLRKHRVGRFGPQSPDVSPPRRDATVLRSTTIEGLVSLPGDD